MVRGLEVGHDCLVPTPYPQSAYDLKGSVVTDFVRAPSCWHACNRSNEHQNAKLLEHTKLDVVASTLAVGLGGDLDCSAFR